MDSPSPENKNGERVFNDDHDCLGYEDTDKYNGDCFFHDALFAMLRAPFYILTQDQRKQTLCKLSAKVRTNHSYRQQRTKESSAYCESD